MVEPTLQTLGVGLASAAKILQALKELVRGDAKAQVAALYDVILSAQTSALEANLKQSAMIERIRELEEEVARIKAWGDTARRYELVSPWTGAFVYALKKSSGSTEPPHWLCQKCYEDGRKSILQRSEAGPTKWTYDCAQCKTKLLLHGGWYLQFHYAEETETQNTDR